MTLRCCKCGRPDEPGNIDADLRPYGPGGRPICLGCALKPEHSRATDQEFLRQFGAQLDRSSPFNVIALTPFGPERVAPNPKRKD